LPKVDTVVGMGKKPENLLKVEGCLSWETNLQGSSWRASWRASRRLRACKICPWGERSLRLDHKQTCDHIPYSFRLPDYHGAQLPDSGN